MHCCRIHKCLYRVRAIAITVRVCLVDRVTLIKSKTRLGAYSKMISATQFSQVVEPQQNLIVHFFDSLAVVTNFTSHSQTPNQYQPT